MNLRNRRQEIGLTLEQVADKVGVTKSTVQKWESGEIANMKRDKIILLSKALKVSPIWIMNLGEDDISLKSLSLPKIPILGTVAAGTPIHMANQASDFFEASSIGADYALKVKGDSMIEEGIHDGDIVFIKQCNVAENGEIVVVDIENETTLKKFYKYDNHVLLKPANSTMEPIIIDSGEVRIMGKLVSVMNFK